MATPNLNGLDVKRHGNTAFIPLPRELWRPAGTCACRYCDGAEAHWDTLAVAEKPSKGRNDCTWMVHMPEAHGCVPKRSP